MTGMIASRFHWAVNKRVVQKFGLAVLRIFGSLAHARVFSRSMASHPVTCGRVLPKPCALARAKEPLVVWTVEHG
jgi:hypothetical protein